ncbi:PucR family transcriptional regulator [Nocardia huaxiensis]|uniref:Helix-turn-helix domain-containing protein n=1 Tax=Nocardia huaxiensis TaxID=2755382 RepID=A0A7D6Z8X6_9NOCA|nr:PucR family transcriptional regulator [Nocardia huaxiensis]QLY29888.1 helix-turn-helix domain-containing protein [Nocardia huaxiensis]UFS96523.1 helix-turn-helix domain-containing protein [Nocardia huaxiensis]
MTAEATTSRERLIAGLLARRARLTDRIVLRARTEIPGYHHLSSAELRPRTGLMIEVVLQAFGAQRTPSETELRSFHEWGVARARQGISLADMLTAWRIAVREILDEITSIGRSHNIADRLQLELVREMLDLVDIAILEFTSGHREIELENARLDHQARAEFVRSVLTGTVGRAELAVRAQRYGLGIDHPYIPFRVRPTAAHSLEALERLLPRPSFTTTVDGDLAGFTDRLPESLPVPLGFADPAPIDALSPGFTQATRALNAATAFQRTGAHSLAELGLLPAVLADSEVGDLLIGRYLDPLRHTGTPEVYLDTLRCYLESGQHIDSTAKTLVVHPNTVRYRIDRFQALTGHDLRKPSVALELWWALQRQRLRTDRPGP